MPQSIKAHELISHVLVTEKSCKVLCGFLNHRVAFPRTDTVQRGSELCTPLLAGSLSGRALGPDPSFPCAPEADTDTD